MRHLTALLLLPLFTVLTCIAQPSRLSDSLLKVLESKNLPDSTRLKVMHQLAWNLKTFAPDSALRYADDAFKLSEALHDTFWMGKLLDIKGVIHQIKAQYREALLYHFMALKLFRGIRRPSFEGSCMNNIGLIYFELKKHDLARHYLMEAAKIGIDHPDAEWLTGCYSNLGIVNGELGRTDESIGWFNKALNDAARKGRPVFVPALMNLAEIYKSQKNFGRAKEYCLRALGTVKNDLYLRAGCFQMLGEIATEENNFSEAKKYFTQAQQLAEHAGVKLELKNIYRNMAHMYEKQRDYKNAYDYYRAFTAIKDSSVNQEFTRQISEMQIKYETGKKDEEIADLNKTREIADQKAENAKLTRNFFIIGFILILLISLVLFRNIYLGKKINTILTENNQKLNEANILLNEKTELVEKQKLHIEKMNAELNRHNRELIDENSFARYEVLKSKTDPHFLFNSLASLSAIVKDNEMATEFLEKFTDLYRMILETGNRHVITLREELNSVNNYLYLQKVRFGNNIMIEAEVAENLMERYLPPFALQIAVENTFKHNIITERKKLTVKIFTENGCLVVSNNLQKKSTEIPSTFTGQKNITERYRLLSDRKPSFTETSTEYIVRLPLLEQVNRKEHTRT